MTSLRNDTTGTNGVTITTGNSGLDTVSIGTNAAATYDSNSWKFTTGATSVQVFGGYSTTYVSTFGAALTTHYGRFYITISGNPAGTRIVAKWTDSGVTADRATIVLLSTGALRLRNAAAGTVVTFTTTLTANTKYRVEHRIDGSTSGPYDFRLYVGDSLTATETITGGTGNFGGTIGAVFWGWQTAQTSSPQLNITSVEENDTGLPGPAVTVYTGSASGVGAGTVSASGTAMAVGTASGTGAGTASAAGSAVATGSAVGAGAGSASAAGTRIRPLADLHESFSGALDTAVWQQNNTAGVAGSVTGGRYEFAISNSVSAYSDITTVDEWSLAGSRVAVRLADAGNQAVSSLEVFPLLVQLDANNKLFVYLSGGFIGLYKTVGGSQTGLAFLTYDPAVHVWFRISETAGTVTYEASPDGTVWTTLASTSTPFAVQAVRLIIRAGEYGTDPAGATTVAVDDVNNLVLAGSASGSGSGTASGAGQAVAAGAAAAAGAGTATAVGQVEATGSASGAGTGAATAAGSAIASGAAFGFADGVASASGQAVAAGAAAGSAVGAATATGTVDAFGVAAGEGIGLAGASGLAVLSGTAAGAGEGIATASSVAITAGSTAGAGSGSADATGLGVAAGEATGVGAGEASASGTIESAGDGIAAGSGSGTATAVGSATAAGGASAVAGGAASAAGHVEASGAAPAAGSGFAAAFGATILDGITAAVGTGTALAFGITIASGTTSGAGAGTATAIGAIDAPVVSLPATDLDAYSAGPRYTAFGIGPVLAVFGNDP